MPNRILKESICTSENVDELTAFQETFFYRMIVNCDDFGRMDARPKVLAARLFPLKNISAEQVQDSLHALHDAKLIFLYEVDGKPYLQMRTWNNHQQVRAKRSKYPSPAEGTKPKENICKQLISNDSKFPRNPIQSNTESNTTTNTETNTGESQSLSNDSDEDLMIIAREQSDVLDAAEDAGFQKNNATREKLIALYADYGKDTMLKGISACVDQGKITIAYLKGCLRSLKEESGRQTAGMDEGFWGWDQ